jgi:hypothetical protein
MKIRERLQKKRSGPTQSTCIVQIFGYSYQAIRITQPPPGLMVYRKGFELDTSLSYKYNNLFVKQLTRTQNITRLYICMSHPLNLALIWLKSE